MVEPAPTEVWFYHLERSTLEQVLPELLERTLKRGWRAQVRVSGNDLRDEIDEWLWTWREDSFLAHGLEHDPYPARQPILITSSPENLNKAQALFIIDQSEIGELEGWVRCFIIFDGRDDMATSRARDTWRRLKDSPVELAYWKQTDGGWQRAA